MNESYIVYCEVVNKRMLESHLGEKKYLQYYHQLIRELGKCRKYCSVVVKDNLNFYLVVNSIHSVINCDQCIDQILFKISKQQPEALLTIYKGIAQGDDKEAINKAIHALDTAIQKQRRIALSSPVIEQYINEKETIRNALIKAIDEQALFILYQPKVDFTSHKVQGFEALLRLKAEDNTCFSTEKVIRVAKEFNLMRAVDEFLLNKVTDDYSLLAQKYDHPSISINLTIKELEQNYHLSLLKRYAEEKHFPLEKLYVEITQDEDIVDFSLIKAILENFKESKIKLSIDDFGSRYNNFYRLEKIRYDEIKIDKSLTDRYIDYPNILEYLPKLFINLGYEVVIEGLESKSQLNYLPKMKHLSIQGYYFSKPLSIEEILQANF
ncbi:MAG: EAL domain-containing protein [Bacilli bacterium]|nr:EAL domain-containing protein [Bacilli bacterium]